MGFDKEKYKAEKKAEYYQKLKDPRWQQTRLRVFERDEFTCQCCFSAEQTLNVHHLYYNPNTEPWDYPMEAFLTLCEPCHTDETNQRPVAEKKLLDMLKRSAMPHYSVNALADAFGCTELPHLPDVSMSVLVWVIEDRWSQMMEEYWKMLKVNQPAKPE